MNRYEILAKRIFDLIVPKFKQKPVFCVSDDILLAMFTAEVERELAPLVEAALQVCYCNPEAFPKTSEDLREALRSALKGWTR